MLLLCFAREAINNECWGNNESANQPTNYVLRGSNRNGNGNVHGDPTATAGSGSGSGTNYDRKGSFWIKIPDDPKHNTTKKKQKETTCTTQSSNARNERLAATTTPTATTRHHAINSSNNNSSLGSDAHPTNQHPLNQPTNVSSHSFLPTVVVTDAKVRCNYLNIGTHWAHSVPRRSTQENTCFLYVTHFI